MNQIELQVLLVFLVLVFFLCPLVIILLHCMTPTNQYSFFDDI